MWGSTVAFITKHCELLQCFQHDFFFLFLVFVLLFFFIKLSLSIFFLILSWLRIKICNFSSLKHCELLQCFPMWFFYDFFQNYLCRFFFNIELVKNYNYNKTKSYEESVVVFLTKYCGLLQYFSKCFLFYFIGKSVIVFLPKHCQLLLRFFSWVFFLPKLSLLVFFLKY